MGLWIDDPGMADADLVARARGGDRTALGVLFLRHRALVVALCRRTLWNSELAEDAAQEACLVAMLDLDRLRRPDRFGPWLAGIGLNICRRWLRARQEEPWSWDEVQGGRAAPGALEGDPADAAWDREVSRRVRAAVGALPAGQRAAVTLFYLSGLPYREMAAELCLPLSAVKSRLHKGRGALRRSLKDLWEGTDMARGTEAVIMRVADVRRARSEDELPDRFVVVLADERKERTLPIWVGATEGIAIAFTLERAETPRPMTHRFLAAVIDALGARLTEVRIERLEGGTFYAEAVLEGPQGTTLVDCRPSDALALALLGSAPIWVREDVLAAVALEPVSQSRPGEPLHEQYPDGAGRIVETTKDLWQRSLERLRPSR
ncbi:MAG TPA: bifunctional nuclease domain-containing protein [Actinomycetota bacterium]|nr:bifunctional nuclease domain-containing protein [Actinomycetota bacterium]